MRDRIWVCRDGKVVLVAEVNTFHIKNAIAMIKRNRHWRRSYLKRLELELEIRQLALR